MATSTNSDNNIVLGTSSVPNNGELIVRVVTLEHKSTHINPRPTSSRSNAGNSSLENINIVNPVLSTSTDKEKDEKEKKRRLCLPAWCCTCTAPFLFLLLALSVLIIAVGAGIGAGKPTKNDSSTSTQSLPSSTTYLSVAYNVTGKPINNTVINNLRCSLSTVTTVASSRITLVSWQEQGSTLVITNISSLSILNTNPLNCSHLNSTIDTILYSQALIDGIPLPVNPEFINMDIIPDTTNPSETIQSIVDSSYELLGTLTSTVYSVNNDNVNNISTKIILYPSASPSPSPSVSSSTTPSAAAGAVSASSTPSAAAGAVSASSTPSAAGGAVSASSTPSAAAGAISASSTPSAAAGGVSSTSSTTPTAAAAVSASNTPSITPSTSPSASPSSNPNILPFNAIRLINSTTGPFVGPTAIGTIYAMCNFQGKTFIGGSFTYLTDRTLVNHMVMYDDMTDTFSTLSCGTNCVGVNGQVSACTIYNNKLVIAGDFMKFGDDITTVYRIVFWTGTQFEQLTPSGVGPGTTSQSLFTIYSLCVYSNLLYIGGTFTKLTNNTVVNYIVAYDYVTQTYRPLIFNNNLPGFNMGGVMTMTVYLNKLIIGGAFEFTKGLGTLYSFIASYDGSVLSPLKNSANFNGLDFIVRGLAVGTPTGSTPYLFVTGSFTHMGNQGNPSTPVPYIVKYDGTVFTKLFDGSGMNGTGTTILVVGSKLIIAGIFSSIDNVVTTKLATNTSKINNFVTFDFQTNEWNSYINPYNGAVGLGITINTMIVSSNSKLLIGGPPINNDHYGLMTSGHGDPLWGVGKYDLTTNTLSPIVYTTETGDGVDSTVTSVYVYNNEVYLTGDFVFTSDGKVLGNRFAKWERTVARNTLISIPFKINNVQTSYVGLPYGVQFTTAFQNKLYIGGTFRTLQDGTKVNGIVSYDPATGNYSPLKVGNEVGVTSTTMGNYGVLKMVEYRNELILSGTFSDAAGKPGSNYLVRWTGTTFDYLPPGSTSSTNALNGMTFGLTVDTTSNVLYIGGMFTMTRTGISARNIVAYDGTTWISLGNGVGKSSNTIVSLLLYSNGIIYMSGNFNVTNGGALTNFAYYNTSSQTFSNIETDPGSYGFSGSIQAFLDYNGLILVGGTMTQTTAGTATGPLVAYNPVTKKLKTIVENSWPNGLLFDTNSYTPWIRSLAFNPSDGCVYCGGQLYRTQTNMTIGNIFALCP